MQLVKVASFALLACPALSKPIEKHGQVKRQRPYDLTWSSSQSLTQNVAAGATLMAGWAECTATYTPDEGVTCGEMASSSQVQLPRDQADLASSSADCEVILESHGICNALDSPILPTILSTTTSSATMVDSTSADRGTLSAGVFSVGGPLTSNGAQSIATLTFTTTLTYIQGTGASTRTRSVEVVKTSAVFVAAAAAAAVDGSSSVTLSTSCTAEDESVSGLSTTPTDVTTITSVIQGAAKSTNTPVPIEVDDESTTSVATLTSTTEVITSTTDASTSSFQVLPLVSILHSLLFGTDARRAISTSCTASVTGARGAISTLTTSDAGWSAETSWSAEWSATTVTITRGQAAVTTAPALEPQAVDDWSSTVLTSWTSAWASPHKRAITYAVTNYAQAAQNVCGAPAPGPTQAGIIDNCARWYTAIKFDDCATIARREGLTMQQFQVWNPAVGGPSCDKMLDGYAYCVQSCTYNPLTGSDITPAPGAGLSAGSASILTTNTSALVATSSSTFGAVLSTTPTDNPSTLPATSITGVVDVAPPSDSASPTPTPAVSVPALIPVSSIPPTVSTDATEAAQVALSSLSTPVVVASEASVAPSSYSMLATSVTTSAGAAATTPSTTDIPSYSVPTTGVTAGAADVVPSSSSLSTTELSSYSMLTSSVTSGAAAVSPSPSSFSTTELSSYSVLTTSTTADVADVVPTSSSSSTDELTSSTTVSSTTLTTSMDSQTLTTDLISAQPVTIEAYSSTSSSPIASAAVSMQSYSPMDSASTSTSSSSLIVSAAIATVSSSPLASAAASLSSYAPEAPVVPTSSSSPIASAAASTKRVLDPNYAALAASSAASVSAARLAMAATTTPLVSTESVSVVTSSTLTTVTITVLTSPPDSTTTGASFATSSIDTTSSLDPTTSIDATSSTVATTSTTSDVPTPSSSVDLYKTYKGNGSEAAGWPSMDKWVGFDAMWAANEANMQSSCSQWGVPDNTPQELTDLRAAIEATANLTALDRRFLLAIVLQESTGCVRVITTQYSVFNPGLMQSHNGTGSCNTNRAVLGGAAGAVAGGAVQIPCPAHEIAQMVRDGANGTESGDGLAQVMRKQGHVDVSRWYRTARMYNGGSIDPSGDLDAGCCTLSYASDVANRLTGWVNAPHDFTG